jgi:hypothetical protein
MTTLREILENAKFQVTAQDLVNGNVYTSKGWEKFNIEDSAEIFYLISETLGGHKKTKDAIKWSLYKKPQHWGLSRVLFDIRNGKIFCSYCAGQDYTTETQIIRNYLKNI